MIINKILKRYNAPTPVVAKKIGGAMFLIGSFLTGDALHSANPVMGTIGMVLTLGSKLVNLWVDESAPK